jgi:hypothetical protein
MSIIAAESIFVEVDRLREGAAFGELALLKN